MSGFAVEYEDSGKQSVLRMMKRIRHRGPHIHGLHAHGPIIIGQNYLHADAPNAYAETQVPIKDASGSVIAWDGQIGNTTPISKQEGIETSPFLEEMLVMHLYHKYGLSMFDQLSDSAFAFVLWDGKHMLAARDLLGIKTMFYGYNDRTLYMASELKALESVTEDIHEFPPGHYMNETGVFKRFASLPAPQPQEPITDKTKTIISKLRNIIERSFSYRVDFSVPTACLLSGGMDSSVISLLASKAIQKLQGSKARLKTFAIGVGESDDIKSARIVAAHLDTDHEELLASIEEMAEVLPEVIYYLESFDPSLVRSAVSNYLISRQAHKEGYEVLLSGEGGDEIFCGYSYLKDLPASQIPAEQIKCLSYLHNNAALRLDRMNQCHSIKVVTPLISSELLEYALALPIDAKLHDEENGDQIEKWIFRKAYEYDLPDSITQRRKAEFSQGSGSAGVLPEYVSNKISDSELEKAQKQYPFIRSKEEFYYFRIFRDHFGDKAAVDTVGQWLTL
jgi:asparagine synthase (glutamine-hydrolysing)